MGHRVGLMLENRPAAFLHWFALNALGASVVPLNAACVQRYSPTCLAPRRMLPRRPPRQRIDKSARAAERLRRGHR